MFNGIKVDLGVISLSGETAKVNELTLVVEVYKEDNIFDISICRKDKERLFGGQAWCGMRYRKLADTVKSLYLHTTINELIIIHYAENNFCDMAVYAKETTTVTDFLGMVFEEKYVPVGLLS